MFYLIWQFNDAYGDGAVEHVYEYNEQNPKPVIGH